jgi:hypothetical protein
MFERGGGGCGGNSNCVNLLGSECRLLQRNGYVAGAIRTAALQDIVLPQSMFGFGGNWPRELISLWALS